MAKNTPAKTGAKAAPKAPVVARRTITAVVDPVTASHAAGAAVIGGAPESHPETSGEQSDMVTVTVPKTYKLRKVDHTEVTVTAGVQEMPSWMAEHWWSKANGVEIYQAKK